MLLINQSQVYSLFGFASLFLIPAAPNSRCDPQTELCLDFACCPAALMHLSAAKSLLSWKPCEILRGSARESGLIGYASLIPKSCPLDMATLHHVEAATLTRQALAKYLHRFAA